MDSTKLVKYNVRDMVLGRDLIVIYCIYGFTCILKNIFIYNLVFVDWSGVTCHIVNVSKFNSILLCFSSKWQYMIKRNIKAYIKMLLTREMLGVEAVESKYALLFF